MRYSTYTMGTSRHLIFWSIGLCTCIWLILPVTNQCIFCRILNMDCQNSDCFILFLRINVISHLKNWLIRILTLRLLVLKICLISILKILRKVLQLILRGWTQLKRLKRMFRWVMEVMVLDRCSISKWWICFHWGWLYSRFWTMVDRPEATLSC